MFSYKPIKKREKIYKSFSKLKIKSKNNLIFFFKNNYQKELINLVNLYLAENINYYFNKKFKSLNESISYLKKLPNLTPGGIINPRKETQTTYNLITKYIIKSMDNISNKIEKAHFPVIRLKYSQNKKNRPYATSKLHSDSWVGQYGDAIISFGIDGDFINNGVEFFLPKNVTQDFFEKIKDYDLGMKKFKGLKYLGVLKKEHFVMFDHSILHRSKIKKNARPRISIDFGVKIKSKYMNKKIFGDKERWQYIDIDQYNEIGKKTFLSSKYSVYDKKINLKSKKPSLSFLKIK